MEPTLAEYYRGRRVAITGGLGFIGSNLAHRLVHLGARVLIIDSLLPRYGGNLFNIREIADRVTLNISDVRDEYSMNYLVRDRDLIFNLAGQVSHLDSMEDPRTDLEINTRSQISILQACRANNPGVKIVFAGTRQVYGKPQFLPVTEAHPLQPVDANGINKLAGEWYHLLYHRVHGIRTVILRLTNTYGPRQLLKHDLQGFMGWFLRQALTDGEIQLFGTGEQRRDLNYVDDVVEAFLRAGLEPACEGGVFNLGHPAPVSLKTIAETMTALAGTGRCRVTPFPEDRKRIDIGDYYSSFAKFTAATGWEPRVDLQTGLTRTLEYYRAHLAQYR